MVPKRVAKTLETGVICEHRLHLLKYLVPPSLVMINLQGLHQRPTYGAIHYGYSLCLECTLEAHELKVRYPANCTIGRWWNY
jgi:hypothetical protein